MACKERPKVLYFHIEQKSRHIQWRNKDSDQLFGLNAYISMGSNPQFTITVIPAVANGSCTITTLCNVVMDRVLDKSLISRDFAQQTRAVENKLPAPLSLVDASGRTHKVQSCIDLKWWPEDTARTEKETFYISDNCGNVHSFLRNGINPVNPGQPAARVDILVHDRETQAQHNDRDDLRTGKKANRDAQKKADETKYRNNLPQERDKRSVQR